MFWTILALVMTPVMGAVIAYNGDVIGRRFGKRRVTLWGMRPRHTAVLITSCTGFCISALTTAILFMAVPPVRRVILDGETAIREAGRLASQIKVEQASLERTRAEVIKLQIVQHDLNRKVSQLQERLARAQEAVRIAQGELRRAQSDVAAARADVAAAEQRNAELSSANADLGKRNVDLRRDNAGLAAGNARLGAAARKLEADNHTWTRQNAALQDANDELGRQNEELTRGNATLGKQNDALSRSNDALRSAGDEMVRTNQQMQAEQDRLTRENAELAAVVRHLAPEYNTLADAYVAVRSKRVAVHGGEDLARCVVRAGSSPEEVRQALDQLMDDAGQSALGKGAGPGTGSKPVRVADKRFWTQTAAGPNAVIVPVGVSADDRVAAVVSRLSRQPTACCVLALAVANSVEQEPALIDFQPFLDPLIYPRGGVVGARRFEPAQPADRVFTQMVDFLRALGQEALKRGAIPRLDPITGEPQVGSLGAADIVKLVERVRSSTRPVRVTACAAGDTMAADPLQLDFKLEPTL